MQRKIVVLVYASTALSWASYALLVVILPFRFQSLGLSVVQYGIAVAILALGMLLTEGVWGVFAFRIGKVRTILFLGIVVALIYVAIGVSDSFLTLAVSLGLLGALGIFQVPLVRWIALTALGPGTGGRGTGIFGLFSGVGLVVGTALGPLVYVEFGFSALTLVVVALYLVGLAMIVVLPWQQVTLPPRQRGFVRHMREVVTKPFVLAAALAVFAFFGRALVWNFLQYYSVSLFQGTPSEAGYVIGAAQGASLVSGALLGTVVDRWGPGRSTPFGFVLVTLGIFGTLFSSSYTEMFGATMVFATGLGWLSASILPLALGPMPARLQGTALGVFGSFEDFGLLLGPILISAIYTAYGADTIFLVVGAVELSGLLFSLVMVEADRHRFCYLKEALLEPSQ
ncbi:MAG: MFS transporter [Thaumarchaeota archaeon]|nr:MFS transporter [Nitrososphaerota archaeon]